jgi:hypothetical protein
LDERPDLKAWLKAKLSLQRCSVAIERCQCLCSIAFGQMNANHSRMRSFSERLPLNSRQRCACSISMTVFSNQPFGNGVEGVQP